MRSDLLAGKSIVISLCIYGELHAQKCSQPESARSLSNTCLLATNKKDVKSNAHCFERRQRRKQRERRNSHSRCSKDPAAPKAATSAAGAKRDLFPIGESDEEDSPQEKQEGMANKRLQHFRDDPDWELVDNDKVLTGHTLRLLLASSLPVLCFPVSSHVLDALRLRTYLSAAQQVAST